MKRKDTLPIPEPNLQLQRQLDQFRSSQPLSKGRFVRVILLNFWAISPLMMIVWGIPRRLEYEANPPICPSLQLYAARTASDHASGDIRSCLSWLPGT